jgi:hypothetical protein
LDLKWGKHNNLKEIMYWDISNPDNDVEEFAKCMARDLGLS